MNFKNPGALFLFIPLFFLMAKALWDISRRKKNPRLMIPAKALWHPQGSPGPYRFLPLFGFALAACFVIIALARPQTSYQKISRNVDGIDIMLVLDISASMRIEDFRDSNRIDVAKRIMKQFIKGRSSDKIGFEAFSGESVTLVPPTLDYPVLLKTVDEVNIGDLKDGTAIGDALSTAVGRLKESRAKSRIIILLTDGDSNVGMVDPLTGGELAKGYGIKIYSIAMGRDGRVAMPFVQKDVFGREEKRYQYFDSSINPDLLKQISSATGGKFYRVQDDEKLLSDVFTEIDALEKTKIETTEQTRHEEHFMRYVRLASLVMALTLLLQQTILRVTP